MSASPRSRILSSESNSLESSTCRPSTVGRLVAIAYPFLKMAARRVYGRRARRTRTLLGQPALAVARVFARWETRVRLGGPRRLLLDAGAVADRRLVDAVAAPARP